MHALFQGWVGNASVLKTSAVLCRHDVPAHKGGLEEPQILDELVYLVGECTLLPLTAQWRTCKIGLLKRFLPAVRQC